MKTINIVLIVAGSIALIYLIYWLGTKQKDVVTGVSNDKIQKSAESAGIPKETAKEIAKAPDSAAAAAAIGVPPLVATAIANGVALQSTPTPSINSGELGLNSNIITTVNPANGTVLYVGTIAPNQILTGGDTTSGKIKAWGGKIENGVKMCFDTSTSTYVPCPQQAVIS